MNKRKDFSTFSVLLIALFCMVAGSFGEKVRAAQVVPASTPLTISATVSHASCPAPIPATTQYCLASDGLYISLGGGPYALAGAAAAPAPAGVTSVNGKTGAVVIGATVTLQ